MTRGDSIVRGLEAGVTLLALATLVGGLALLAGGCGDPLATQARAATITAGVLSAGGSVLDAERDRALDRVEERFPADPEHDAQLDLEAARWRPVGVALDSARTALLTWAQSIELARVAGGGEDLVSPLAALAGRVVQLYTRVVEIAVELGVEDLPALPATVRALASSVAGGQ